jgi:hypothetical protein
LAKWIGPSYYGTIEAIKHWADERKYQEINKIEVLGCFYHILFRFPIQVERVILKALAFKDHKIVVAIN